MTTRRLSTARPAALLTLLIICVGYGCGTAPDREFAPNTGATSGDGGTTAGSSITEAGSGNATSGEGGGGEPDPIGGAGGTEPNGGAGGEPEPPVKTTPGKPGQALVAGGIRMSGANYTLVIVTGESPGGEALLYSSPKFRMVGGVIGTTQP